MPATLRFPARRPPPASARLALALLLAGFGLAGAGPAPAKDRAPALPAREYLGLRLGLSREAVNERFERREHARPHESEERESESWSLTDRRFGYVSMGFDDAGRLSWFTLFSRRGGRPVLMREIGALARAEQKGNYIFVWTLPAASGRAACRVIARSQDPDTLRSLSVLSLGERQGIESAH
jgi:hypothetical protein